MKLSKEKAIELSIKKWQWIVDNNGSNNLYKLLRAVPELKDIEEYCGLCHKYLRVMTKPYSVSCGKCPIDITKTNRKDHTSGCWQDGHPFMIFEACPTKEYAQKVLDLIK